MNRRFPAHIHWYLLPFVPICVFLVSLWTLRPGHSWGDDFAMYILQARNFADGQPHRPTGYLFNPGVPHVGPPEYPPIVPLILSGVYKFRGMDLKAMKIALLLVFVCSLVPLYFLTDEYLRNPFWSAAAVLSFGLNPVIVSAQDSIGSDLALLPFVFTCLYLIHVVYRDSEAPPRAAGRAVLCGLLTYFAYATRSVGAVLIFVPPALDLLKYRRISRFSLCLFGTLGTCLALQTIFLRPSSHETSILRLFVLSPAWAVAAAGSYLRDARYLIPIGWKPAKYMLYMLTAALGASGAVYWARRRAGGPLWLFTAAYSGVILLYQLWPLRYVFPLVPVVAILVAGGATWVSGRLRGGAPALYVAFAVYALGCVYSIVHMDRSPDPQGIGDPQYRAVCDYITRNSPADAVIISVKPRLLTLLTGRRASYSAMDNVDGYLRSVQASYVLVADNIPDENIATQAPLRAFIKQDRGRFLQLLAIGPYHLYRLT